MKEILWRPPNKTTREHCAILQGHRTIQDRRPHNYSSMPKTGDERAEDLHGRCLVQLPDETASRIWR